MKWNAITYGTRVLKQLEVIIVLVSNGNLVEAFIYETVSTKFDKKQNQLSYTYIIDFNV